MTNTLFGDTKTKHDRLGESPARFEWVDALLIIAVGAIFGAGLWRIINIDTMMGF